MDSMKMSGGFLQTLTIGSSSCSTSVHPAEKTTKIFNLQKPTAISVHQQYGNTVTISPNTDISQSQGKRKYSVPLVRDDASSVKGKRSRTVQSLQCTPVDTGSALFDGDSVSDQNPTGNMHYIITQSSCTPSSSLTNQRALFDCGSKMTKMTLSGPTVMQNKVTKSSDSSCAVDSTGESSTVLVNPIEEAQQVAHGKVSEYLKHIQHYALALHTPLKWWKVKRAYAQRYLKQIYDTDGNNTFGPYLRAGTGRHVFAQIGYDDGVNVFPWPQNVTITGLPHDTRWVRDTPLEFWCWDTTREQHYCQQLSFLLHLKFGAEQYHHYTSTASSFPRYHDMTKSTNFVHDVDDALSRWFLNLSWGNICSQLPGCPCQSDKSPHYGALHYIDTCIDYKLPSHRLKIGNKRREMSLRDLFTPSVLGNGFQQVADVELFRETPGEWSWMWNHDAGTVRNWYGYWLLSWGDRSRRTRLQYSMERHVFGFLAYIHLINKGFQHIQYQHQIEHDSRITELFEYWDNIDHVNIESCTIMDESMLPFQKEDHRRLAYAVLLQQRFITRLMEKANIKASSVKNDPDTALPEWLILRDPDET